MRHLPLTFPQNGLPVAIANVGGKGMRYEIAHEGRGAWCLIIDADDQRRSRTFSSERAAKSYARDDFRRRQLLKRVMATEPDRWFR